MNNLIRFYNEKMRLPHLEDQISICKKRIEEYKEFKSDIFPSPNEMLIHPLSELFTEEISKLSRLIEKQEQLKDRLGAQNAN